MATGGYWFKARHSLTRGLAAKVIRANWGHKGIDQYVSLLCDLTESGGELKVTDYTADIIAEALWFDSADDLRQFCGMLAELELIDRAAWEGGTVLVPEIADGLALGQKISKARSEAGKKGAEARWKPNN